MIRHDGYYIAEPVLFDDRKGDVDWYLIIAFLFKENGELLRTGKYAKENETTIFSKIDFISETKKDFYEKKNKELIVILDKGEKWERKVLLELISSDEFIMNDKKYIFIKWQ